MPFFLIFPFLTIRILLLFIVLIITSGVVPRTVGIRIITHTITLTIILTPVITHIRIHVLIMVMAILVIRITILVLTGSINIIIPTPTLNQV